MKAIAQSEAVEEPDRIEGQAHPRETYDLFGQQEAMARAAHAVRSGRLPQGWLLAGAPGIGKATLAYRIARYLLRYGTTTDGPADLFVAPADIVSRQIQAQAHPGLLALKRPWDEKKKGLKSVITVKEIRRLGEFFGLKSSSGGWRIALIDSMEEMSEQASNALLKTLEEPPAHSLLILVSHAPGRLLPTIRSRVQRLDLKPIQDDELDRMLARLAPALGADERAAIARTAGGSLGLALKLADEEGAQLAKNAEALLAIGKSPDWRAVMKLAERIGRRSNEIGQFGDLLLRSVSRRIRTLAEQGGGDERSAELWEQLNALFARAVAVNLDPRQTVFSAAALIEAGKRHHVV